MEYKCRRCIKNSPCSLKFKTIGDVNPTLCPFNTVKQKEANWKKVKTRSNNQNAYMWKIVYQYIADEMGEYDKDEIHDLMRNKFWYKIVDNDKIPLSTKKMSTAQIEEYLTKCRNWAYHFLNVSIPLPNQAQI